MSTQYPKILSNIPEGEDLFKSESHKRIARSIIKIIEQQGNVIDKQIIGLEGDWGAGKSNIIKIIENDSKDKYLHFTYDTWTHQEDLTKKSILEELIYFLKDEKHKVIDKTSELWNSKENELTQKVVSKSTSFLPTIKLYYIILILAFIIIKSTNEFVKQVINNRVYGFYDDSIKYLRDEFYYDSLASINWTYLIKLFPFLLILFGLILFVKSAINEISKNNKIEGNEKLSTSQLVGKIFYWVTGDKIESSSNEKINEREPSNLRFRNFLKDIDKELITKKKTLILTIDNTDRLTDDKLKSIWSTINIFFAENNNGEFLKNIWLIIPYDPGKVISAFNDTAGVGLLEKTFALSFKVPPPLISNWELFFQICFDKSFGKVDLDERQSKVEILLRIYENFEKEITPRRIVNFINQLATYYIQNPKIELRYFAIIILKKNYFIDSINERIIDRINYLDKLNSLFVDDNKLELCLAKIIYGLEKDEDAEEALLHNEIDSVLINDGFFEKKLLNTPSFNSYFFKYFKKFIDRDRRHGLTNDVYFDKVTRILLSLKETYINKDNLKIYNSLWQYYYNEISTNKFTTFNDTHKGVLFHCSRKAAIEFITSSIENIISRTPSVEDRAMFTKNSQIMYVNFLNETSIFLSKNDFPFSFDDFDLGEQIISSDVLLELIKNDKDILQKFKLDIEPNELKKHLEVNEGKLNISKLTQYKNEILFLQKKHKFTFVSEEMKSVLDSEFTNLEDINTLIFYYLNFGNIKIENLSLTATWSVVNLLNNASDDLDKTNAFYLLFLNYREKLDELGSNEVKKALLKFKMSKLNNVILKKNNFSDYSQLINVLKLSVKYKNITDLKEFSNHLLKSDSLKLNEDGFNWMLENYSFIDKNVIVSVGKFKFFDYLNSKANGRNFDIKIEKIDLELITKSSKYLSTEIIRNSNEYLVEYFKINNIFLLDTNTKPYLIFKKLIALDRLQKQVLADSSLAQNFISFVLGNSPLKIDKLDLLKIKSLIDREELDNLINTYLNRIVTYINRTKVYLISPEIFKFFHKIPSINKPRVLQVLIENTDYYNVELIEEVSNSNDSNSIRQLKKKLESYPDGHVKDFAIEKGILTKST